MQIVKLIRDTCISVGRKIGPAYSRKSGRSKLNRNAEFLQIDVETEKMFLEGHLKPERDDGPEMKGNHSLFD